MSIVKSVLKYVQGGFYVVAGMNHFINPDFYMKIMPPYLPWHAALVFVSGLAEVFLGVLLIIPRTTKLAAWGLMALLLAVFPANIYVYQHQDMLPGAPSWLHLAPLAHPRLVHPVGVVVYAGLRRVWPFAQFRRELHRWFG